LRAPYPIEDKSLSTRVNELLDKSRDPRKRNAP
jgi:hypothetical protein